MTRRRTKWRNKKGRFAWFYAYDTYIVQLYCSHSHSVMKDWLYLCAQTIFQLKLIGILVKKSSSWMKKETVSLRVLFAYVFFFSFLPFPFVGKKILGIVVLYFLRSICKLHVYRCSISYKSFLSVQETQLIVDHETYDCWIKSG